MNHVKNITKKAFTFLMIFFVGLLMANEAIYKHTHQINGHIVTHAHPYKSSSDSSSSPVHKHSKAQIAYWENVELLFPIIAFVFMVLNTLKPVVWPYQTKLPACSVAYIVHQGRAPPVVY